MLNVGNKNATSNSRKNNGNVQRAQLISMYREPPMLEVSIDEFEQYSIDRLRVLKTIESARAKGFHTNDFKTKIDKATNTFLPLRRPSSDYPERMKQDMNKDALSHFILRMSFCQNEDLRRWFLNLESQLFRHRVEKLSNEEKLEFMRMNGLDFEQAPKEDIDSRRNKLKAVRDSNLIDLQEKNRELGIYFKIPFIEALELVATRKVFIERGIAFVPMDHLVSILFARFRSSLSRQLAIAYKNFSRAPIGKDERLLPLLKNLSKQHIAAEYSVVASSQNRITPEMLDGMANSSMPLCMRSLHHGLRVHHHLKYGGRQQYGLFLKGIGVTMDDAVAFWKQEFCKKMSVDEFNKKYTYNIRHIYGKEGKRKDYIPYNCSRVISGDPPKTGEYHGCPFRHYEPGHLKATMRNVSNEEKENIMGLVKSKQYQLACRKYFEATHPSADSDTVGNHPNLYFDASQAYYISKTEGTKTEPGHGLSVQMDSKP